MEQEFDGKTFRIAQPVGTCCESGCEGCELYVYKKEKGLELKNPRAGFYQQLIKKKKEE